MGVAHCIMDGSHVLGALSGAPDDASTLSDRSWRLGGVIHSFTYTGDELPRRRGHAAVRVPGQGRRHADAAERPRLVVVWRSRARSAEGEQWRLRVMSDGRQEPVL